jgi:hypothetical protein
MKKNWKTLPVFSSPASAEELLKALKENGIVVGYKACQLIRKLDGDIQLPSEPVEVSIVTNTDLDITGSVNVQDFCEKAMTVGHKLCTPEIGILARLAYRPTEQIENYDLWFIAIAMEPVEVDGEHLVLRIAAGTKGSRLDAVKVTGENACCSDEGDNWLVVSE